MRYIYTLLTSGLLEVRENEIQARNQLGHQVGRRVF